MALDVSNRFIDSENNATNVRAYPKRESLLYHGPRQLRVDGNPFDIGHGRVGSELSNNPNVLDMTMHKNASYFMLQDSVYHFFMDCVGSILDHLDSHPDTKLILDTAIIKRSIDIPHNHFFRFFFEALKDHGYDVDIIDSSQYSVINFDGLYIIDFAHNNPLAPDRIYNFFKKYVKKPDQAPYRNVYLSRSRIPPRPLQEDRRVFGVTNDDRIDDHGYIENTFRSLGFEIACPEDFKSFEEQINFFYSVKTLVSITSSGLVNCCLMQPNQTIVEIVTPLVVQFPEAPKPQAFPGENGEPKMIIVEQLHHFYQALAFYKNHNYFSIQNWDRDAVQVEESILREPYVKLFFDRTNERKPGFFKWKKQ